MRSRLANSGQGIEGPVLNEQTTGIIGIDWRERRLLGASGTQIEPHVLVVKPNCPVRDIGHRERDWQHPCALEPWIELSWVVVLNINIKLERDSEFDVHLHQRLGV